MLKAIVSIHDVMPDTIDRVASIHQKLKKWGAPPATLLVCPGLEWTKNQLAMLRGWEEEGCLLAGHGWSHRATTNRDTFHKLHSVILSRDAAEHLSRSRRYLYRLLHACHSWFSRHGLRPPSLYVPPAWAMGALTRDDLSDLPFNLYEVTTGILNPAENCLQLLPLCGYEADTHARACFLKAFNNFNEQVARRSEKPLRVSIHPFDLDYHLADDIEKQVRRIDVFQGPGDLW